MQCSPFQCSVPSIAAQSAVRAHSEAKSGEWRLSLLPLRPLEKVPSDIEVREDMEEEVVTRELWRRWGPE